MKSNWIILFVFTVLAISVANVFFYRSVSLNHILHLVTQPKDLYKPVVVDNISLDESGFTRTYDFNPKYSDRYEVGISVQNGVLPSSIVYKGEMRIELILMGKPAFSLLADSFKSGIYADKSTAFFKDVTLLSFPLLAHGKFREGLSIRITVTKPDKQFLEWSGKVKMFIRVSPSP